MKAESMIPLQLEFSGALLPVVTNEQGERWCHLPIVDVIGLNWKTTDKGFNPLLGKAPWHLHPIHADPVSG